MDMETRALKESETVSVYESSRKQKSSIQARRRNQHDEQEDRNDSDDTIDIESQQQQQSSSLPEEGGEECPVCFEVMHDNSLRVQRCEHLICAKCYSQWTTSCPICRGPMLRMVHEGSGKLLPRVLPELTKLEVGCYMCLFVATVWSLSSSMVVSFLLHWLPKPYTSVATLVIMVVGIFLCDQDKDAAIRGVVGVLTLAMCLVMVYYQIFLDGVMTLISVLVMFFAFLGFCHVAQRLAVEWNDLDRKTRGAITLAAFLSFWLTILYFVLMAFFVFCILLGLAIVEKALARYQK